MPKEIARACLDSLDFTLAMPNITRSYPVPSPVITDDGPLHLALPGYHPETGAFVFDSDFQPDPELCAPADPLVSSGGSTVQRVKEAMLQ